MQTAAPTEAAAIPIPTAVQTPASGPTSPTPPPVPIPVDTPTPAAVQTPAAAAVPTAIPPSTPLPALPGIPPVWPSSLRYAIEGNSTTLTWNSVAGAAYYNVYYDDFFDSGCTLNRNGAPRLCEELATNVSDTTYVHADREGNTFYYWVNACNSDGCSPIDSDNPAMPIEPIPTSTSNVSYAWEGLTIRISWNAVDGADHYNVYYDDFHSSGCRLNRDGSPSFCEELAANVVETSYVHAVPNSDTNYYWVVACNRGGCSEIDSANPATPPDTSSSGPADIPAAGEGLRFADSAPATRSIPENTPGGVYVGTPVSVVDAAGLAYTMSGTDAANFSISPSAGQILTREGVVYDYETQSRHMVVATASDDEGNDESIDVTIHIEDLAPACAPLRNLRTNHGDGYITVRWNPASRSEGMADVLGYHVEIRQGDSGPWADRRTLLGRSVASTIYQDLENLVNYWVRVRPVTAEGDCAWSPPFLGIPAPYLAPIYPEDRFDTGPVGSDDRNWRFLSPTRCRYTGAGITVDASCRYQVTGPDASRITLEFDDPSLGSCEVAMAYSSLTAGSFIDECFQAGVNTETPFDTSFRMPRSGPQTESETDVPRVPRSQEEFDVLAWGRDDFIPGLFIGCPPVFTRCLTSPGQAWQVTRDPATGLPAYTPGESSYTNLGPSKGVITFRSLVGDIFKFTLEVDPSGHMRVAVADDEDEPAIWPGMSDLELLDGQPILLPIPPSWWDATSIETDSAPENLSDLEGIIPTPGNPDEPNARVGLLEMTLLGDVWDRYLERYRAGKGNLVQETSYRKIGHNRGEVLIVWVLEPLLGHSEELSEFQKELLGSTWAFDLNFTTDGTAQYTLTITREGSVPSVRQGFVDFNGSGINLDEFPEEVRLPVSPPQASGEDVSGVELAAAISANEIGGADIQTFLVSDEGLFPEAYSPGDWLEPKDGSNQRMMIVGGGQVASALHQVPPFSWFQHVSHEPQLVSAPLSAASLVLRPESRTNSLDLPAFTSSSTWNANASQASYSLSEDPTITQLLVLCMQKGHNIPTRGARYFSAPKTAEGPVQLCQRACVLNESDNIQECVWKCEGE